MGAQRGLKVHVLDRVTSGLKPQLVHELGAEYHTGRVRDLPFTPDIIIECTGVCQLIVDSLDKVGGNGIVCLAGVSSHGQKDTLDVGCLNRKLVLENGVIFGTVNANRHHYDLGQKALLEADQSWLGKLITRRVPVDQWQEALKRHPDDIKVVLEFGAAH
jgi:threonine dehydrogenase-like Zn-dependent dehydrogenase